MSFQGRMTKIDNLAVVIPEKEEEGVGGEERKTPNSFSLIRGPRQACSAAFKSFTILPSKTNPPKERTPRVPHESSIME